MLKKALELLIHGGASYQTRLYNENVSKTK